LQTCPLLGPESRVITLQNGVDSVERLAPILGEDATIAGTTYVVTTIAKPGVIHHTGTTARIRCGRLDGRPDAILAGYVEQMKAGNVDITLTKNMLLDIWKKFVLLSGTSGMTASTRKSLGLIREDATMTSADIAALIEDAKAGIAEADKERAVDQALLSNSQARCQKAQAQEQATEWLAEHDRLKGERDALAEELRAVYPDAVAKIMDLFVRITANDESLSGLHRSRPPGMKEHLLSAELHARGLDNFRRDKPSLLETTRLIDWASGREIWPPPQTPLAVLVAASVPRSQYRGADWWKTNERRAAEQQAERQRVADYYARAKREQEERENSEARERFIAQQQTISRTSKS
jgi:hypothetical protein